MASNQQIKRITIPTLRVQYEEVISKISSRPPTMRYSACLIYEEVINHDPLTFRPTPWGTKPQHNK